MKIDNEASKIAKDQDVEDQFTDLELKTRIKNVSELEDVNEKFIENLKTVGVHPCYSESAHFKIARIHLPVAPKCNIQCNYCKRDINKVEDRPGVTKAIMKPEEALEFLDESIEKISELRIIGIAGPGEPLANRETFETFKLVKEKYPGLHRCVATNGLLLPESIDELADLDVSNITVTINAIDPSVFAQIYEFVFYQGKKYEGEEAGRILRDQQLKGIELATKKGLLIRVNTVLIPTINLKEIKFISKEACSRGALIHNIMPLIPIYNFKNLRKPTLPEMRTARHSSEAFLPQFKLCRQCRADAVGVPGLQTCLDCEGEECSHVRFHG